MPQWSVNRMFEMITRGELQAGNDNGWRGTSNSEKCSTCWY
jgi:hypothetical protein